MFCGSWWNTRPLFELKKTLRVSLPLENTPVCLSCVSNWKHTHWLNPSLYPNGNIRAAPGGRPLGTSGGLGVGWLLRTSSAGWAAADAILGGYGDLEEADSVSARDDSVWIWTRVRTLSKGDGVAGCGAE